MSDAEVTTTLFDASMRGLEARAHHFGADLKRWRVRTAGGGELEKHHSQLSRLQDYLDGALTTLVNGRTIASATTPPFEGTVDDVPELRRSLGSVHLLWDFYRDKLVQRDMDVFATHLAAADDLAWACYEPFLTAACSRTERPLRAAEVKEPPLVFYSTDRTPFAQARTKTLHPPGLDAKDVTTFVAALLRLPVPVIGMPWEVANRMPETALVGHEAGHVIAEDLGLAVEARLLLRDALPDADRAKVWLKWSDEVLADVLGVLATGSSFVLGLTAELTGDRAEIRQAAVKPAEPGRYPTPMLRVALCERVLAHRGIAPPPAWASTYGEIAGNARDYVDDLDAVVAALLDSTWTAVETTLPALLPWDPGKESEARTLAAEVLHSQAVSVPFDVRVWVAAAAHASLSDPRRYLDGDLDTTLAAQIVDQRTAGVRSSRELREPLLGGRGPLESADPTGRLRAADRAAGAELAQLLGLATRGRTS